MKETMAKMNKTKSWFFEKIKKFDKALASKHSKAKTGSTQRGPHQDSL